MAFSMGAIPLTEIAAYIQITGETCPDQRGMFTRLIRRMDDAYLQLKAEGQTHADRD